MSQPRLEISCPKPPGVPIKPGVRLPIILIAASLFLTLASQSEARRVYRFGKRESIFKIQDVDLRDKDGQPLVLAHKITVQNFVAGVSLHDDGYVLQRKDKTHYEPLTPEQITQYQAAGQLPNPLPKYSISFWDYFFGYSLWIILVGVTLFSVLQWLVKRGGDDAPPAAGTSPPDSVSSHPS